MDEEQIWLVRFAGFTIFSMLFAGAAYYIQFEVIVSFNDDPHSIKFNFIRLSRMLLGYVLPVIVYAKITGATFTDFGLEFKYWRNIYGFFLGVGVYLIASVVFVEYNIFVHLWRFTPWNALLLNLFAIGVMAAITDFWTRGFVLFQLQEKYGDWVAILGQNVVWYSIHVYEIIILIPYIGLLGANILTLFIGISGDFIALRTNSIWGLMAGHFILNVIIMFTGKGVLF